jgi:hypothetical protein
MDAFLSKSISQPDDVRRSVLVQIGIRRGRIAKVEVVPLTRGFLRDGLEITAGPDRQTILDRLQWQPPLE